MTVILRQHSNTMPLLFCLACGWGVSIPCMTWQTDSHKTASEMLHPCLNQSNFFYLWSDWTVNSRTDAVFGLGVYKMTMLVYTILTTYFTIVPADTRAKPLLSYSLCHPMFCTCVITLIILTFNSACMWIWFTPKHGEWIMPNDLIQHHCIKNCRVSSRLGESSRTWH